MIDLNGVPLMATVEEILNDLKTELLANGIDLLDTIRDKGENMAITCPRHAGGHEKRPSCGVTNDVTYDSRGNAYPAGTVHCFTCDYRATLDVFVSDCFGHEDLGKHGMKWLIRNYGAIEQEKRQPIKLNITRKPQKQKIEYITEEELKKYRYTHPYMYKRKLTDIIIDYFDIGFDKEKQCITFPVCDKEGKVLFIQRRSVNSKFFDNGNNSLKGITLYGIDKVLQNLDRIEELYIVESPIDALTCWVYKKPAVALMGTGTDEQMQILKSLPIRKLIFATDNDDAGQKAIKKISYFLRQTKIMYKVIFPEDVKDVNELDKETFESLERILV